MGHPENPFVLAARRFAVERTDIISSAFNSAHTSTSKNFVNRRNIWMTQGKKWYEKRGANYERDWVNLEKWL
jgi:hypothetical protein